MGEEGGRMWRRGRGEEKGDDCVTHHVMRVDTE